MSAGMASQTQGFGRTWVTDGKCVAGIDVGGERKGFHLVVLRDNQIVCSTRSLSPEVIAERCVELGVVAVGVDAPCQWGQAGAGRLAEKQLSQKRIFCFSTPTRALAVGNNFYGWMFNGERMYDALSATHLLFEGVCPPQGKVYFETFPHAITCAFLGTDVAFAPLKRKQRSELLQQHQIDLRLLRSIDAIDAGLCALTAGYVLAGNAYQYGDKAGGYLLVPNV